MDIDQLRSMGLVHSNPLLRRQFKVRYRPLLPKEQWEDPDVEQRQEEAVEATITVWLRKLTAADQIELAAAMRTKRDYSYMLMHRCTFNEQGQRLFPTEEDAIGVDLSMFAGLLAELKKINEDLPAKKSAPRMSSGASSPSASADDASPNGKTPSPQPSSTSGSSTAESTAH